MAFDPDFESARRPRMYAGSYWKCPSAGYEGMTCWDGWRWTCRIVVDGVWYGASHPYLHSAYRQAMDSAGIGHAADGKLQ